MSFWDKNRPRWASTLDEIVSAICWLCACVCGLLVCWFMVRFLELIAGASP